MKRLLINIIGKNNVEWALGQEEVATEAIQFYQTHITSKNGNEDMLENINSCITRDDNLKFNSIPLEEEIRRVVFKLNGDSASVPYGFTGRFYQVCWSIIGSDVVKVVNKFFSS